MNKQDLIDIIASVAIGNWTNGTTGRFMADEVDVEYLADVLIERIESYASIREKQAWDVAREHDLTTDDYVYDSFEEWKEATNDTTRTI